MGRSPCKIWRAIRATMASSELKETAPAAKATAFSSRLKATGSQQEDDQRRMTNDQSILDCWVAAAVIPSVLMFSTLAMFAFRFRILDFRFILVCYCSLLRRYCLSY